MNDGEKQFGGALAPVRWPPPMPPCQVCGGVASRQWRDGSFCGLHDTFYKRAAPAPTEKQKD